MASTSVRGVWTDGEIVDVTGVGIVQGTDGASRLILQPGQVTMTCR
ncbi:MAG: hypothetical protein IT306_20350 [Chloroflexi bacterium]|nr:hypothetical protein [Chloroflexota bacterium]